MAQPLAAPFSQFFDNNGIPLAGGLVYTYAAGTTTPQNSYTDSTGGTPAANPVVLDSAGRATIWLSGNYKIVVKDSLFNTIGTADNITALGSSGDMNKSVYDPANIQEQLVGLTAVQTLTNKTLGLTVKKQAFSNSGTYTPTSGMYYCIVEVQGAGGGSGGVGSNSNCGGGGGGAGSYSRSIISAATIGVSQTVTIGASGTAGANTGTDGGAGGASSLGSLVTTSGGAGGAGTNTGGTSKAGGAGGAAATGDLAINGNPGFNSVPSGSGSGTAGQGGNSVLGSGGFAVGGTAGQGNAGLMGGGGGGSWSGAGSAFAGAIGGKGYVFITEFCSH